jgi:hypothetical protein
MKTADTFNARVAAREGNTRSEAQTESKVERVTRFAEESYERSRRGWTNHYYGELLKREGHVPTLQPAGVANDRSAHLMRAASKLAAMRHQKNLSRIDKAAGRQARGRSKDGLER